MNGFNTEEIIRMAVESGMTRVMDESSYRWLLEGREPVHEVFIKFANLIAIAEQKKCLEILDELAEKDRLTNYFKVASNAIRARGNDAA